MSDPVTNVEIEDVLSSIRRLVSENARHDLRGVASGPGVREAASEPPVIAPVVRPAAPSLAAAKPESGMLLLTPAHRIETETEVEETAGDEAESGHHWADDGAEPALDDVDEDRAAPSEAELEALAGIVGLGSAVSDAVSSALDDVLGGLADAAQDDEAAPEPESFAEAIWDTDELSDEMSDAADVSEDAATEPPGVEAVFSTLRFAHREPEPAAPAELSALASRIAELEAAVAESADDEWEPDGAGEGDNAGAPVDALSWEDADDAQGSHAWEADPLEAAEDAELAEPEPDFAAEPELTAEPAFDAEPEPEPDLDDRWADPHLARDIDPEADLFAETDSVIDEDMLRDLIADIVRRELQGTLGERITRNVRKLVRREIHRALSARELD